MATQINVHGRHYKRDAENPEYQASITYTKNCLVIHNEALWLFVNDVGQSNSEPTETNTNWLLIRDDSGASGSGGVNKIFTVVNSDAASLPEFTGVTATNPVTYDSNGTEIARNTNVSATKNTNEEFTLYGLTDESVITLATTDVVYDGYIETVQVSGLLLRLGVYMDPTDGTISIPAATPADGLRRIGTITGLDTSGGTNNYTAYISIHANILTTSVQVLGVNSNANIGFGSAPFPQYQRWGYIDYRNYRLGTEGTNKNTGNFVSVTQDLNGVNYSAEVVENIADIDMVPEVAVTDLMKLSIRLGMCT